MFVQPIVSEPILIKPTEDKPSTELNQLNKLAKIQEENNALFRELISAVKAGGNVYIDGNKAGTAFNIGTYRTQ